MHGGRPMAGCVLFFLLPFRRVFSFTHTSSHFFGTSKTMAAALMFYVFAIIVLTFFIKGKEGEKPGPILGELRKYLELNDEACSLPSGGRPGKMSNDAVQLLLPHLPHKISASPHPYIEVNADGTMTTLIYVKEGELDNPPYEVTDDGYAVQKIKGTYKYLERNYKTGALVDSGLVCGRDDPKKSKGRSGKALQQGLKGKKEKKSKNDIRHLERNKGRPYSEFRHTAENGTKKQLLIAFKFSDHSSRISPSTENITILMNNEIPNSEICPTGSVRNYYSACSYGQVILYTTVTVWVTLPHNESYYADGQSGLSLMAHIMIRDALDALQATGFDFTPHDTDNDGFIDAIGFLHSGYAAEFGGTDSYGANYIDRIWSHQWALSSLPGMKWTSKTGQSIYKYYVSSSLWSTSGSMIARIGLIAHEVGHLLGLPDLYGGNNGSGIGSYCLMANAWGFDGTQYYPPMMSAWSKVKLGWVTPTIITQSGTYIARQGCEFPNVFMITNNFSPGEYFLIENRQCCKYDAKIPGPGLSIFHIDESAGLNTQGYPGQTNWPMNAQHYLVALLQADGKYNLEKGNNHGDDTDLFYSPFVTGISSSGTSAGSTYPNTNAYKGGIIRDTGISISNISPSSSTMTFDVQIPDTVTRSPVIGAPISKPTSARASAPAAPWKKPKAPTRAPAAPFVKPMSPTLSQNGPYVAPNKPVSSLAQEQKLCSSIQENEDFLGNTIANASSSMVEGCCGMCAQQPGCKAFSWSGGTCYFKSGISLTKNSAGVRSATFGSYYCASLVTGLSYNGTNIKILYTGTADGCCLACKTTPGCTVFSWIIFTNTCQLKTVTGTAISNSTVVSGTIWW